jgi:hypothetical protein
MILIGCSLSGPTATSASHLAMPLGSRRSVTFSDWRQLTLESSATALAREPWQRGHKLPYDCPSLSAMWWCPQAVAPVRWWSLPCHRANDEVMKCRRNPSCGKFGHEHTQDRHRVARVAAGGSLTRLPRSRRDTAGQAADFSATARKQPAADQQAETIDLTCVLLRAIV